MFFFPRKSLQVTHPPFQKTQYTIFFSRESYFCSLYQLLPIFFLTGGKKKAANFFRVFFFFSRHLFFYGTFYIFFRRKIRFAYKNQISFTDAFFTGLISLVVFEILCYCNFCFKTVHVHRLLDWRLASCPPCPPPSAPDKNCFFGYF